MQWLCFFKKKISFILYLFMFRFCFDILILNVNNTLLKYVNFQRIVALFNDFVFTLCPRNSNYGRRKKILKNPKDFQNASFACIIESMSNVFFIFFLNWVLVPSFFWHAIKTTLPNVLVLKPYRKTGLHIAL